MTDKYYTFSQFITSKSKNRFQNFRSHLEWKAVAKIKQIFVTTKFFETFFEKFFNNLNFRCWKPFSEPSQPVLFPDCGCKDMDKKITVQMFHKLFYTFFALFLIFLKKWHLYLYILYIRGKIALICCSRKKYIPL